MATNLYETLNVSRNATAQEIRQAYRRMALETHPDKLPRDATPEEKKLAEEKFRDINNAYEVLSDESKRQEYNRYGRWPVEERQNAHPDPSAHRHRQRRQSSPLANMHDPFNDPFFADPFGFGGFGLHHGQRRASGSRSPFGLNDPFTNPFELFNSFFSDDPFLPGVPPLSGHFGHHPHMPFSEPLFGGATNLLPQMGHMFPTTPLGIPASFHSQSVFARGSGGNGQWVSESRTSRSVNGVTESEWKRVDANGNIHVTRTYPDGRERYLLNGVEQPARNGERAIEQPPPPPYPGPPSPTHSLRGPEGRRSERSHRSDGPYNSVNNREERDRHYGDRKHRHDRERVEQEHLFVDVDPNQNANHDRHRKHWWRRH